METLNGLLQKVDVDPALGKQFADAASQASGTAEKLRSFDPKADSQQGDALFAALSDSQDKLVDAYDKLDDAAAKERDKSASSAGIFRGIAWICTALGAVLMGDWRKLFGGSDEESDEEKRASQSRTEAAV
jgi:hypothetical protein